MKVFFPEVIWLIIFFISSVSVFAQTSLPDTLWAFRINEEIEVDGDLDEDVWEQAQSVSNFTQRELNEGQPATENTEVIILYNESHLYIGISAYDSEPELITAKESKRDFSWSSDDNFEILLGPYNDNRSGYLFVINPNGAMADVQISDEGSGFNLDWNGVWQAEVEVDEDGWFAEIEIPFSTLKFPEVKEQVWALNMERNIRRKNEQVLWQGWSRDFDLEKISQAGRLAGLKNIAGAKDWEFKPFVNVGSEKVKGEKAKAKYKFGGDINYQISPKMKLNFTVNTDFSQVESDREEINLTRFDLEYPEKREFFLEGKDLFDFSLGNDAKVFYSRRIGLHQRKEVPIICGLRLVGKADDTNIGVLSIQSAKKDSLPTANYSVLRLKQDVFEQSNIGFILTSRKDTDSYNYVYGFDANYSTSEFLDDKNLEMGAAVSQSFGTGQSGKDNLGYKAFISCPNDLVEFNLYTFTVKKNFNPGVGFLRRKDYRLYFTELQLNPRPDFLPFIKNLELVPFEMEYYFTDHIHKLESVNMEFRPLGFELKSGDKFEFNIQRFFERLDKPFEIVDDVFIPSNEYWFTRYEIQLESFSGRRIFSNSQYSWGNFYTGQRRELEFSLGWNLHKKLNVSADWDRNEIKLNQNKFTTDELGGRIEYAFNPMLYTSFFGQWNNEDDEVILNFRLNWLPAAGSYFYFVVNQEYSTANSKISLQNTTIISKLIWRFAM